jgi:hypothetical protein
LLKAQNEKYKKRANYLKNKFFAVKSKEDKVVHEAVLNNESKYRLKNSELKKKMGGMQE